MEWVVGALFNLCTNSKIDKYELEFDYLLNRGSQ